MPAQPPPVWNKEYWGRDTEIVQVSVLGLAVDMLFAAGLLAAVAMGWSLLGSQRLRFWQFTFRQALALMLVVFGLAGYVGAMAEGARRDRAVTRQLQETIQSGDKPWSVYAYSGWGGPAWVRNVFDYGFLRRRLGIFMRTSSLSIGGENFGDEDLLALEPLLEQLPHLRSISTPSSVTLSGATALEESLSSNVEVRVSAPW